MNVAVIYLAAHPQNPPFPKGRAQCVHPSEVLPCLLLGQTGGGVDLFDDRLQGHCIITPPNFLHIINIQQCANACFVGKGPAGLYDGGVMKFFGLDWGGGKT